MVRVLVQITLSNVTGLVVVKHKSRLSGTTTLQLWYGMESAQIDERTDLEQDARKQ